MKVSVIILHFYVAAYGMVFIWVPKESGAAVTYVISAIIAGVIITEAIITEKRKGRLLAQGYRIDGVAGVPVPVRILGIVAIFAALVVFFVYFEPKAGVQFLVWSFMECAVLSYIVVPVDFIASDGIFHDGRIYKWDKFNGCAIDERQGKNGHVTYKVSFVKEDRMRSVKLRIRQEQMGIFREIISRTDCKLIEV